jgi:hypothetical protein
MTFAPTEVRYIKLGPSGAWARATVRDGTLPFGFREAPHEACLAGDWEGVRTALSAAGRSQAAITQDLREIRAFYELGPDALWVTFCDGRLYWCFAEAGVDKAADDRGGTLPSRVRQVIGGWKSETLEVGRSAPAPSARRSRASAATAARFARSRPKSICCASSAASSIRCRQILRASTSISAIWSCAWSGSSTGGISRRWSIYLHPRRMAPYEPARWHHGGY